MFNLYDFQKRSERMRRAFIHSDNDRPAFHNRNQEREFMRSLRLRGMGFTRKASTRRRTNVGHRGTPNGVSTGYLMAVEAQRAGSERRAEHRALVEANIAKLNEMGQ